jgi:hypothetical protein
MRYYLIPIFMLCFLGCSYVSSTDKEREIATKALLVNALTSSITTQTSCEVAAPAFSTLKSAGFESSCGRSGCHDGTTRFQASSYSQVKNLTIAGSPAASLLYTQVKGSMAIYSSTAIDKAIYCWIQGGSNP